MPEATRVYSGNPITKDGLRIEISAAVHFLNISSSNTLHVVLRMTQIATISFGHGCVNCTLRIHTSKRSQYTTTQCFLQPSLSLGNHISR